MAPGDFLFDEEGQSNWRFSRKPDFFQDDNKTASTGSVKASPPADDVPEPVLHQPPQKQPGQGGIFTVTRLMRLIKLVLLDQLPGKIILEGEISNFKRHGSGHLYFTLKDDKAQIAAVMWKRTAGKMKFVPADGMAVVATGRVDVFEPQGKVQFYVEKLEPAGMGALDLAFRQMADKLRAEGLFDDAHKKPLPKYPSSIAIITSDSGAAVKDIVRTLNRRFPAVRKLLYPVLVQGRQAADSIVSAIRYCNRERERLGGIDVIIVGRGGGSIEDLWAFNEEAVARAIFASAIPVISAVGHEVDITIADLVADVRAATPTAAAELAVPDRLDVEAHLQQLQQRLRSGMRRKYEAACVALRYITRRALFLQPTVILQVPRQQLDDFAGSLQQAMQRRWQEERNRLEIYARALAQIEPRFALAQAHKQLTLLLHRLQSAVTDQMRRRQQQMVYWATRLEGASCGHRLQESCRRLEYLQERLRNHLAQYISLRRNKLEGLTKRLENLDPRAILQRGYSITRLKEGNRVIDDKTRVREGDMLVTELARHRLVESKVAKVSPAED